MTKATWLALIALVLCGAFGSASGTPEGVFPADPPNREWARLRRFEANAPVADGYYGEGVALEGDVLAIGSPGGGNGTVAQSGLVEVWTRDASGWTFAQYLTDPLPVTGSEFGHSVDLCGGGRFIIVGAPGQGDGAAYIFEQDGPQSWSFVQALVDADLSDGASSGYDVAIDCDTTSSTAFAAVGAPFDDVGGTTWSGSVAMWRYQISGTPWVRSQRIAPHAGELGARCGLSVDLSYTYVAPFFVPAARLLFGCPYVDYLNYDSGGIAHVYARSGSTFAAEQTIGPPDPDIGGEFGTSVALAGTYAAISAPWARYHSVDDAGRVWVFERSGAAPLYWEGTELVVDDFYSTTMQYFFGGSVAIGSDSRGIYVHASRTKSLLVTDGSRCFGVVETFAKPAGSSSWVRSDRLASPDIDTGYDILNFGSAIAADGPSVLVGAARSKVQTLSDGGVAFLFAHERVFGGDFEGYRQTE